MYRSPPTPPPPTPPPPRLSNAAELRKDGQAAQADAHAGGVSVATRVDGAGLWAAPGARTSPSAETSWARADLERAAQLTAAAVLDLGAPGRDGLNALQRLLGCSGAPVVPSVRRRRQGFACARVCLGEVGWVRKCSWVRSAPWWSCRLPYRRQPDQSPRQSRAASSQETFCQSTPKPLPTASCAATLDGPLLTGLHARSLGTAPPDARCPPPSGGPAPPGSPPAIDRSPAGAGVGHQQLAPRMAATRARSATVLMRASVCFGPRMGQARQHLAAFAAVHGKRHARPRR